MSANYTCPCCGYAKLEYKPYANIPQISETRNKPIPYEDIWGRPSYDVCSCCSYEFGFDDNPGEMTGETFEQALEEWIQAGCDWMEPEAKPAGWSLQDQLSAAGIERKS